MPLTELESNIARAHIHQQLIMALIPAGSSKGKATSKARPGGKAGDYTANLNKVTLVPLKEGEEEFDDVIGDDAQYGRIQFWDLKYASEHEPFEWYYPYDRFRDTIRDAVPLDYRIMVAGCGTSNMLGDMLEDGYDTLVGADLSRVAITQMKYRYQDNPQISFFQGTMTDTDLPEGSFGAVVDKALFDALLCTQTGSVTVQQYVNEVERLLDDTGVFIIISYGNPEQRLQFLEQYDIDLPHFTPWVIEVQAVLKPKEYPLEELDGKDPDSYYFVYVCKKRRDMVIKKKVKLGRLNKKALKALQPTRKKAPNLKPNTG